jgi:hypothetical protein
MKWLIFVRAMGFKGGCRLLVWYDEELASVAIGKFFSNPPLG